MTPTAPNTSDVASTGNDAVDTAIQKQAQAVQDSIVLATNTNTAVSEINSLANAVRKIQPT